MQVAKDIRTSDWDLIVKGLINEGWQISMKYNEFDAHVDFDFIELKRENETVICGWDNWLEGEIKASKPIMKYIENSFEVNLKFGKPVVLKSSLIQMTKAQILLNEKFRIGNIQNNPVVNISEETSEIDTVLLRIYKSDSERIPERDLEFEKPINGIKILDIIGVLVETDLVEYDKLDKAYYLTSEGYERVEKLQEILDNSFKKPKIERRINYFLILLVIIVIVSLIKSKLGIPTNSNSEEILNEEVINDIQKSIKQKMDSLGIQK